MINELHQKINGSFKRIHVRFLDRTFLAILFTYLMVELRITKTSFLKLRELTKKPKQNVTHEYYNMLNPSPQVLHRNMFKRNS
jgi:hypothetical protein